MMPRVSDTRDLTTRDVLARYPALREDHLRYLEKWGLVQPARTAGGRSYGFADLAVIRQTAAALASGRPLRAIVRQLEAERHGQLAFDFRLDATPARVIALTPRERPTAPETGGPSSSDISRAEALFLEASALDTGDDLESIEAESLYRRALEADPYLVAALINLGNLHYGKNRLTEALALYEQAIALAPDYFEAHYNRANVLHDAGRFAEAADSYAAALELDAGHADAHFYLAVTLEKLERSAEARPYWEAYRRLAPTGAWAELAREFTENL
jgi:tetratricopeptide (TPR) repeat protein